MKFNSKAITRSLAKEFAPEVLSGILQEEVKDKSVKDFYDWLDTASLWDKISPSQQQFLLSYKPWNLDWLNIDFVVKSVAKSNAKLAVLVATSPELQSRLEGELKDIKGRLENGI